MDKITNLEVKDFLQDFKMTSETQILEEGREIKDLLEIAKAKGINLKKNSDLAGFKTIYAFTEKANKNKARLPEKKLLEALPTIIGKPVDIDHNRSFVVGHYIDYRYIQKDKKIIAYGVFYKSNFGKEWKTAKKLLKAGKLSTSYEIWCPQNKRKNLSDGTYQLLQMEIAGGALLFTTEPAFEDAKVLEVAKKNIQEIVKDLVFSSKYQNKDLLTAEDYFRKSVEQNADKLEQEKQAQELPQVNKIKCSNCESEFESAIIENIPCPKCSAIVNKEGSMIYPPQILDFKVLCPSCNTSNWLLVSKTEENAITKCLQCKKDYTVTFDRRKPNEAINKLAFVFTGNIQCPQCGTANYYTGVSGMGTRHVTCEKCKLQFPFDIAKQSQNKNITKIEETIKEKVMIDKKEEEKKEEKGGQKMEQKDIKKKIEKPVEEVVVKEEVKVIVEEQKVEKSNVEKSEKETTEEKALIKKETPKVEETQKEEKEKVVETPEETASAKRRSVLRKAVKKILIAKKTLKKFKNDAKTVNGLHIVGLKKLVSQVISLKEEKAKIEKDTSEKIDFYKSNAKKIVTRRNTLDGSAKNLTDKEILNDDKFALALSEKNNTLLKAQIENSNSEEKEIVAIKDDSHDDEYYTKLQKKINEKAFGKKNNKDKQ